MKDRGGLATYWTSALSKITNLENTSQLKLVRDSLSNRVFDSLFHSIIPITLYDNLLKFHDTGKEFKILADLSKMIKNKKYNIDVANSSDKKLMYDFAKKRNFHVKTLGNKSVREWTLPKLLKTPAIITSATSPIFSPSDTDELCDTLKVLLQEKQAGKNSDKKNEEINAVVDKLLEYKCISKKQQ